MKLRYLLAAAASAWLTAQQGPTVWETAGFESFRAGKFDAAGANLYVSRDGTLQTVHRWDVNNDGSVDLIFNNTHDLVYVPPAFEYRFRGRTPQRFEFPGAGSVRVRATDLDHDGSSELLIARGFDNSSRFLNSWLYWGSPQGWSEARHTELPSPYVQDACTADFNGDGLDDVAFVSSSAVQVHTSYIYWGRRDGFHYLDRTPFETPGATSCLAADIDRDGKTDLLIAGPSPGARIYWAPIANGAPTAVESKQVLGAAMAGGKLVLATAAGPRIYLFSGRASQLEQEIAVPAAARVASGDLNGDGIPDLVVARTAQDRNWEIASWILWGAAGGYSAARRTELPTVGAADAAIADLDADGFADVIFANSRSYRSFDVPSYVYWGDGKSFEASRRTELPTHGAASVSTHSSSVFFANAVKGRVIGDIDTYVYLGDGKRGYSTQRMLRLPTIGGYESCTADLNDDGFPDLLLVGSHEGDLGGPAGSYIYWGGAGGFSTRNRAETPTRGAIGCAIGDLDRDGRLDLVFANMDDNTLSVFPGAEGGFPPAREIRLPVAEPRFPSIADLNNDGFLDLVAPSLRDGLVIFWGSASGFDASRRTMLPGVGTVSSQVADFNRDGFPDVVVSNLVDEARGVYHTVNTTLYWGSASGFSGRNRTELPSLGSHHAVVADFNRDGALDIFLSNYQSEFTRDLDSHIYWGGRDGNFSASRRQAIHPGSAAGVLAADLDGDGWTDLAISNHMAGGDHHAGSPIYWNGPEGFSDARTTRLPTIGPHMMTGVDRGHILTRSLEQAYESGPFDSGGQRAPAAITWDGATPFGTKVRLDLRGAASRDELAKQSWTPLGVIDPARRLPVTSLRGWRWWQYRATLVETSAASPSVRRVRVEFSNR